MEINDRIREQVIADLQANLVDGEGASLIAAYFNGLPAFLEVAGPNDPDMVGDIPAVAVSIGDGAPVEDDFEDATWQATMTIRIYLVATNAVDTELDILGQKVIKAIGQHYTANGLLELCNRRGFEYGRDDEQPWGMLDLSFLIEYTEG